MGIRCGRILDGKWVDSEVLVGVKWGWWVAWRTDGCAGSRRMGIMEKFDWRMIEISLFCGEGRCRVAGSFPTY